MVDIRQIQFHFELIVGLHERPVLGVGNQKTNDRLDADIGF
jgi:hypothetical protein